MADPFANTVKFLTAVNLLASPRGTTVRGLTDSLGISRRSVFRMLEALDRLGFPLTDGRSPHGAEKTYRLTDSYVLKLPNISIPNPNPGFSGPETELLLSVIDSGLKERKPETVTLLKSIRRKIILMSRQNREGRSK